MKVLCYQRVSTYRQNFGRQDDYAQRFCELNGYELAATCRDFAVSGQVPPRRRHGFRELVCALAVGKSDLVSDIDRLTRDPDLLSSIGSVAALLPCPIVFYWECWATRGFQAVYDPEFVEIQRGLSARLTDMLSTFGVRSVS